MVDISKFLFIALKLNQPCEIKIKFENGIGTILIDKAVVFSKVNFGKKNYEGEEAFKEILKNQAKAEKIDLIPLVKLPQKNMLYNIHKIMEVIETLAIEKAETSKNWIDQFLINIMAMDSNWIVNLQGTTFKGKLYLFNRQYVDAFFIDKITKEKETGEKAFEKIIKNKDKIETVELLPLKEQPNIQFNKGFTDLLNILN